MEPQSTPPAPATPAIVTPTPAEIAAILAAHSLWVNGDAAGERAALEGFNLYGANLDGANLSRANLYGANLYGANLYGANLDGANLDGANLDGANLDGANLSRANLDGANLSRANLSRANLDGANLDGANLDGANLYGANLSRANLDGANLDGANLYGANLSRANLDGAVLATGETWQQYLAEVVPALLTAGGKSLDEVMGGGCWTCHTWDNCPMAEAFSITRAADGPILLRPRIEQFVNFFDAQLIEAVKDEGGGWVFRSAAAPKPGAEKAAA